MYLSHADGVPITNPRTLKPSSIVIFVPSNTFMALWRWFSLTMSSRLEGFTLHPKDFPCTSRLSSIARRLIKSPAALPSSVYLFWVTLGFCRSSLSEIIPIPYIAIARGSPCVLPSVDVKTVFLTYKFEGCLYELASAWCSSGQRISTFSRASSLLSELKAFSASKSSMAFIFGFSNSILKLWIAYLIPHFWFKQNWKNMRDF